MKLSLKTQEIKLERSWTPDTRFRLSVQNLSMRPRPVPFIIYSTWVDSDWLEDTISKNS